MNSSNVFFGWLLIISDAHLNITWVLDITYNLFLIKKTLFRPHSNISEILWGNFIIFDLFKNLLGQKWANLRNFWSHVASHKKRVYLSFSKDKGNWYFRLLYQRTCFIFSVYQKLFGWKIQEHLVFFSSVCT